MDSLSPKTRESFEGVLKKQRPKSPPIPNTEQEKKLIEPDEFDVKVCPELDTLSNWISLLRHLGISMVCFYTKYPEMAHIFSMQYSGFSGMMAHLLYCLSTGICIIR